MAVGIKHQLKSAGFIHGILNTLHSIPPENKVISSLLWAICWQNHRVPKELISRFVKICPTCQIRRGGLRITPPSSRKSTPQSESISHSPGIQSPFASRRESMLNTEVTSQEAYLDQFDNHHFWMNNQHVDERQTMNPSQLRSFGDGTLNSLPHVPTVLDPFASDVTMPPSQMTYNPGYTSSHPFFKP